MTRPRYLAIVARRPAGDSEALASFLTDPPAGFACSRGEQVLLFEPAGQAAPSACSGTIVGQIFAKGTAGRGEKCPLNCEGIAQSRGAALVVNWWGNYVAFVRGENRVDIVRAPLGNLGCYYVEAPEFIALASDVDILVDAGLVRRRIAWDALARHIARPETRTGETSLQNIAELQGGHRLTISGDCVEVRALWSPWHFADSSTQERESEEAVAKLFTAVRNSIAANADGKRKLLLLLSGGLDSSIVAASLADCGADFDCLNLIGHDPASDEQRYARAVALKLGRQHHERWLDPFRPDIFWSAAARAPYPVARCFNQASDGLAAEVAHELGAEFVFDGGGGDNLFFGSRSVTIPADCLLAGGFDRRFWSAARTLGELGQTGLGEIVAKAVHRAWFRSRRPRTMTTIMFLSPSSRDFVPLLDPHPWVAPPSAIWPGRAAHTAMLVPAQNLVEAMNGRSRPKSVSPLVTQPVAEACLGIASWLWIAPGRDRAAAREAYRSCLPPAVIERRSKGTPNGFVARLFEHRRQSIRAFLAHGLLAAHGLLDLAALGAVLDDSRPLRDFRFARVMDLVDAEAWARAQY